MKATLSFFGAAGTVTGSKYLLSVDKEEILLDAGLFQGLKALRLRNWSEPPFDPALLRAIVLSHAHIDHSGYLPLLARKNFSGKIFCTSGTADLLEVMLMDAAHLQEEEAEFANRKGYSKHKPALPLYGTGDVQKVLRHLAPCDYGKKFSVTENVDCIFRRAGHILGSATVELQIGRSARPNPSPPDPVRLVFSGDLGRWDQPILRDPEFVPETDVLLIESTYGDRLHPTNANEQLAKIVHDSVKKGGVLLIPAFAVGRTQELIWILRSLEDQGKIPVIPVYVDSPMAINVTDIYSRHPEDHDLDMKKLMDEHECPLATKRFHLMRTPEESKSLNRIPGPAIIISSSGMATGGRILHHLRLRLPDPKTTVLLAGFQATGTRGRSLQDGAKSLRMFGEEVPVRAKIEMLEGVSAHADRDDILRWLKGFKRPPRQTYLVHGEAQSAERLAETIQKELGWNARAAIDGETVQLD